MKDERYVLRNMLSLATAVSKHALLRMSERAEQRWFEGASESAAEWHRRCRHFLVLMNRGTFLTSMSMTT